MAVTFLRHREVAQIPKTPTRGAQVTTREAAYNRAQSSGGVEIRHPSTRQFIIDGCLMFRATGTGDLRQRTHPWQAYFASNTSSLNNTSLPVQTRQTKPIIGAWEVMFTMAGLPLTWVSWEEMRAWLLHTTSLFTAQPYIYDAGNSFTVQAQTGY